MVSLPGWRPLLLALLLCAATPLWARTLLPASGSIEVVFSPWDDAEGAIIGTLQQARQAIHVQAYLFTSQPLAQALIAAHRRGVRVEVLADQKMLLQVGKSQIPRLAEAGIPVWLETRHAIAHNKLMLIDPLEAHPAVVTGSYNFTYSAQARNAENLLILRDNPALARAYFDNWQRHRGDAVPYTEMETGTKMETEAAMEGAAGTGMDTATGGPAREAMP